MAQPNIPTHPTCETRHTGLRGFIAKAAEQLALFAIAARLEQDGPHDHVVPHSRQKADTRSPRLPAQTPPRAGDRCSQRWWPMEKQALPSG